MDWQGSGLGHGVSSCVDSGQVFDGESSALLLTSLARNGGASPLCPAAGKETLEDTGDPFDFQPVTDAQESMSGEARHKTVGGRGVVGRLIDKARK